MAKQVYLLWFSLWLFLSALPLTVQANTRLSIEEINPTERTSCAKKTLEAAVKKYDVDQWIYTRKIRIESKVIPHSDPVLTLNTKYCDDIDSTLVTFLHEEMHWYLNGKESKMWAAVADLKQLFPRPPFGQQQKVAKDADSTYIHLIVCWYELALGRKYLGKSKADQTLRNRNFYTWIYEQELSRGDEIRQIINKHGLLPKGLGSV